MLFTLLSFFVARTLSMKKSNTPTDTSNSQMNKPRLKYVKRENLWNRSVPCFRRESPKKSTHHGAARPSRAILSGNSALPASNTATNCPDLCPQLLKPKAPANPLALSSTPRPRISARGPVQGEGGTDQGRGRDSEEGSQGTVTARRAGGRS